MSLTGVFDGQRYVTTDNLDKCDFNLQAYCWCSDAVENGDKQWLGDPTEIAVTSIVQNKRTRCGCSNCLSTVLASL